MVYEKKCKCGEKGTFSLFTGEKTFTCSCCGRVREIEPEMLHKEHRMYQRMETDFAVGCGEGLCPFFESGDFAARCGKNPMDEELHNDVEFAAGEEGHFPENCPFLY